MKCNFSECKRSIPLSLQFECKCKKIFCNYHRSIIGHNCIFDYRAEQQKKLRLENPLVHASKINKI